MFPKISETVAHSQEGYLIFHIPPCSSHIIIIMSLPNAETIEINLLRISWRFYTLFDNQMAPQARSNLPEVFINKMLLEHSHNSWFTYHLRQLWGFPDSSVSKQSTYNAEDPGSIPGSGRSAGEGIGYPLQYSWASLVAQLVKKLWCHK